MNSRLTWSSVKNAVMYSQVTTICFCPGPISRLMLHEQRRTLLRPSPSVFEFLFRLLTELELELF